VVEKTLLGMGGGGRGTPTTWGKNFLKQNLISAGGIAGMEGGGTNKLFKIGEHSKFKKPTILVNPRMLRSLKCLYKLPLIREGCSFLVTFRDPKMGKKGQ